MRVLRRDEAGILHLHGHWEDAESVVLGIHSYEEVLGDTRAQFMQQAITAFNSLLFVGCGEGLKDPNFSALRRWLVQFAGWEYGTSAWHPRARLEQLPASTSRPSTSPSSTGDDTTTRAFLRSLPARTTGA